MNTSAQELFRVKTIVANQLATFGWIKDVGFSYPCVARERRFYEGIIKDTIAYVHNLPDSPDFYILTGSHIEGSFDSQLKNILSPICFHIPKTASDEKIHAVVASFDLSVGKVLSEFSIRKAA